MWKLWWLITCSAVISMIAAAHKDALPEHEIIPSLLKSRHRLRIHHHPSHQHASSHKHDSSHRHHYPRELETLFSEKKKEEEKGVCQSEECKLIARIIKDNINKSVNPCDDFYDYACGKFAENNPIPEGETSWSFIQMMESNIERQREEILEADSSPDDLLTVKLGKKYYRSCMDRKTRERKGLDPLVTTIARIGGWPMIMEPEEWDETGYTWQTIDDYYAILTGLNTFYNVRTYGPPWTNETILSLTLPRMPTGSSRLPETLKAGRNESSSEENNDSNDENESKEKKDEKSSEEKEKSAALNDNDDESQQQDSQEQNSKDDDTELNNSEENFNVTEQYVNLISEIAMSIAESRGFKVSEHRVMADANDVVAFQQKIIEIGNAHYRQDEQTMTLREFQEQYDNASATRDSAKINFIEKVIDLLETANVKADEELELVIQTLDFFIALRSLLDETPDRVIINYVHWLYVNHFMDATTEKMSNLHKVLETGEEPNNTETMTKKQWTEKCISEVAVMDITAYAFVKKYFPDEIKKTAEEMIMYVQKEVEREISESEWLDDDIREFATEKVQNIKKQVGYPSWYANMTIMKNYYKGLAIGPSYFDNRMSFARYKIWKNLRMLRVDPKTEESEDEEIYVTPLMLNALYAPFDNLMVVTAADFQNPFFALSRPPIINYAIIGAIMGHEVNHGFDDDGRLYNKNGEEKKWLDAMAAAYNKRVECFVNQYNSLAKDELQMKTKSRDIPSYGNRTRNENIADTMGLEAALGAYRIYEKEKGSKKSREVLPGLENLSHEQLFFLSYANVFCEVVSPDRLKKYGRDVHSTGQLRVLGPISNSESFAKSFNCPVGSPMNPERKCNIWK